MTNSAPDWRVDIIQAHVRRMEEHFAIRQITERYGTLRLYWEGKLSTKSRARVEEAVALAEALSACTCEDWVKEGRLYRAGRVLMTRCKAHAKGLPIASGVSPL